jgi:hypothetical protein
VSTFVFIFLEFLVLEQLDGNWAACLTRLARLPARQIFTRQASCPSAETAWEAILLPLFFPALHLQRFFGSFDFRLFFAAAAALAKDNSLPNNL